MTQRTALSYRAGTATAVWHPGQTSTRVFPAITRARRSLRSLARMAVSTAAANCEDHSLHAADAGRVRSLGIEPPALIVAEAVRNVAAACWMSSQSLFDSVSLPRALQSVFGAGLTTSTMNPASVAGAASTVCV